MECGRRRLPGEYACPVCLCDSYTATVSGRATPQPIPPEAALFGVLAPLLLPVGYVGLLHGPRGAGKTSLALAALVPSRTGVTLPASSRSASVTPDDVDATAAPGPRGVTVYTSEMDPALVLAYAGRLGVELDDVRTPHRPEDPHAPIVWDFPQRPTDLILDSLTALGREVDALHDLIAYCTRSGSRALVIAHEVKQRGEVRGSAEIAYLVDLEIRVTREGGYRLAEVLKNRFGPEVSIPFTLGGKGAGLPTWDRYYSIEGEGGRYSVKPFPPGGPYADAYRDPEIIKVLPPPPLAVAAQRSPLYAGFWVEPADIAERRDFATRLGLPFWSPSHVNAGSS